MFLKKELFDLKFIAGIHLENPGGELKKSLTRQRQPFRVSEDMVESSDLIVSQARPTARGYHSFIKSIGAGKEWT